MATVLTCYYRPKPGGLCKRLYRAMNALLVSGHTVHYLAVVPFPITHAQCHFHRFPWPESRTSGLIFWFLFHLLAPFQLLFLGVCYRVTHLFAFGHNYALLMQPLRLLTRVPLTLFLRSDALRNHTYKHYHAGIIKLDTLFEGLSIAGSRLYGVSRALTTDMVTRHVILYPSTVGVLPNDVPPVSTCLCRRNLPALPLRLACVGVLEQWKNQRLMIQCMAYIESPLAHLYVFGSGSDDMSLKKLTVELGVENRVSFMGWVEADGTLWDNIDLLVFPSLQEGSPNTILEALAYGVPVLASDIPEHREILPATSVLSPYDVESWVTTLHEICQKAPISLANLLESQQGSVARLRFDWDTEIRKRILD